MKVLVLGANGSTGFNVVNQLINHGIYVRALTRNMEKFESINKKEYIEVERASILEIENQKCCQRTGEYCSRERRGNIPKP